MAVVMTFLIVEDNAGMRRLLRAAVDGLGSETWDCCDGAEALDAYVAHRPDIVLMDISMTRVDGLVATRRILLADPSARVVIVTNHDDDMLRAAAREAGASGYVLKMNLLDLAPLIRSIAPK